MITPIADAQSNVNFNASLKTPKLKQGIKNTGVKIKDFGVKVKKEFRELDDESKMLLYKIIVLCSLITIIIAHVVHVVNVICDKFRAIFE